MKCLVETTNADNTKSLRLIDGIANLRNLFDNRTSINQGVINTNKINFILSRPNEIIYWDDGSSTRLFKFVQKRESRNTNTLYTCEDLLTYYLQSFEVLYNHAVLSFPTTDVKPDDRVIQSQPISSN